MTQGRSLRILVDLDGIVADFFDALWREYHAETGELVTTSQILGWDMGRHVRHPERLTSVFHAPGFFDRLEPVSGAIPALKALVAAGHDVRVVTSPCTPHSAAEKILWCARHLPFLDQKSVSIVHRKHDLRGDVLIDDGPHNAQAFRSENPDALIVTIAYPYNVTPAYDHRFDGHDDTEAAWRRIVERVDRHSRQSWRG